MWSVATCSIPYSLGFSLSNFLYFIFFILIHRFSKVLIDQPVLSLFLTSIYSLPYIFRLTCNFPRHSLSSNNYRVSNKHYYDGLVKGSICFSASGTSCLCRRQANEHDNALSILLIIYLEYSKEKLWNSFYKEERTKHLFKKKGMEVNHVPKPVHPLLQKIYSRA